MKAIAIFMTFYMTLGALYPRNDFSQLLRISALADHYECHVKEASEKGESLSLLSFLLDHFYSPESHQHAEDGDAHHKLPLSTINAFVTLFTPAQIAFFLPYTCERQASFLHQNSRLCSGFLSSIFQPPVHS